MEIRNLLEELNIRGAASMQFQPRKSNRARQTKIGMECACAA